MKKLIIFFAITLSVLNARSQTVTFPANGVPLFGGVSMTDWIECDTFPISLNDSIRYMRMAGKNYINKNFKSTTWDAVSLRLFADNTDQTARLVHLFTNRTFIKHYIIRQQFTGQLKIDGNVNIPDDVTLDIDGVIITGNGSITGATRGSMVLAQPDVQVFATTLTVTKIKTPYGYFPAKWFGTVPDGATDNHTMFSKAQAATYRRDQPVMVAWGDHRINSVFTQTVNFIGEPGGKIKYNRNSTDTALTMWTINGDSLLLKGIHFDGSNKVRRCVMVASGKTDVEINNLEIDSVYQVGVEKNTVEGIYFTNSTHRLAIRNCNIHDIDAPNTGISRGIRGDGTTGGLDMVFEKNTFDKIVSTYASNTDADGLCIQGFKNILNAVIRFNKFKNIGKRGAKLNGDGISFYRNEGFSTMYLSGKRSTSFFSVYGNYISATYNKCTGGVYENAVDIGSAGSWSYNTVSYNELYLTETSLGNNDGIRMFGTENTFNNISYNIITHARKGIWLDCSSRYTIMNNNQVDSTTDNAYSTQCTSNSYPNVWHYGLTANGNKAKESTSSIAMYIYRVLGGVMGDNSCDSISVLMYGAALDSVIGVDIHNNVNNTGGSSPNRGVYANRPALTNALACENLEFYATDRDSAYRWAGANGWINIFKSSSGGITSIAMSTGSTGTDMNWSGSPLTANGTLTLNIPNSSGSARGLLTSGDWSTFNSKQTALVSGTNIKTLAGNSLLGSGNLTKTDIGFGNVDNTSDATKNSATATLTNKTISGSNNTLSNISIASILNGDENIYTPTYTGNTNASLLTGDSVSYLRLGNTVLVWGYFSVSVSSTGYSEVDMTCPVTTTFPNTVKHIGGAGHIIIPTGSYETHVGIWPVKGQSKVRFKWWNTGTGLGGIEYFFSYRIY